MVPATNRRALLGTAAATLVALSVSPVRANTLPAPMVRGVSTELLALMQRARDIDAASADHNRLVFEPAKAKRDRAEAAAKAAHPHVTIDAGTNVLGDDLVWTTASPMHVHMARSIVETARVTGEDRPALAAARKLCAADLRRKRAIRRAHDAHDFSDVIDEADAISARASDAQDAVGMFPCRTIADLHAKLAFMAENGMGDGVDWTSELLADAARLSGQEAL